MTFAPADISARHVARLDLSFAPKPWPFAEARRAEIDAHFAVRKRARPALWNGRVLLLHRHEFTGDIFRGAYLPTDFANFLAWRDWGCPPAGVKDCFGAAAILAADGAFLLGVMAAHTANAGRIYFPSGTPDADDIVAGRVDLAASIARELVEETGLDAGSFAAEPGWCTVMEGAIVAQIKILRSHLPAEPLRRLILDRLAGEKQPELADIRIVRGPADFDPLMPRFVTAFLQKRFDGK